MKKKYISKFYKSPIIVDSIDGDILLYIETNKGRELIYSGYNINKKECYIPYINKCLLGGFIKGIPKSVLILGLGGGSYARYLEDHINGVSITGVDIDPIMIEISKKDMKVLSPDLICLSAEKAVSYLKGENRKYDLILLDCYLSDGEMPNGIMYENFLRNCKDLLTSSGVLSINFSEFLLNNNYEDKKRVQRYRQMHESLKYIFGKYFSLLLVGEENGSNSMGIYNLSKFYTSKEYVDNYLECVSNSEILFDKNIIKDTYVDKNLFLQ
ncbi:hypothetical protein CSA08_03485 [Candidatus Gracilibacteria bacterium]|nr:MAG: hypothetical protein CSA08_03485 [Candidatus Gracilibacteria bacterium]